MRENMKLYDEGGRKNLEGIFESKEYFKYIM